MESAWRCEHRGTASPLSQTRQGRQGEWLDMRQLWNTEQ